MSEALPVRSSPRLRPAGGTIREEANPISASDRDTLSQKDNASVTESQKETVDTSQTIKDTNRKRRATPATPDQINSTTQRELKKLEDYWTRHDPVKEDSPRLRSNRKTKFDLKECLKKTKKTTRCPSEQSDDDGVQTCPESPIPTLRGDPTHKIPEINSASTRQSTSSTNINIFEKFGNSTLDESEASDHKRPTEEILTVCFKSHADNAYKSYEANHVVDESNQDQQYTDSQKSQLSDLSLKCSQTTDGCNDLDEEFYIPPRKKLRSEVRKDELWEGFPLGFSFKRLAPLSRKSESEGENKSYTTGIDSQSDLEGCIETPVSSPFSKDNEDIEYHVESSLESTIIYAETDLRDSRPEETNTTFKLQLTPPKQVDIDKVTNENSLKDSMNNHTPRASKNTTVNSPKTPRKSLRLLSKSNLTPEKTNLSDGTQTIPKVSSLSFDDNKIIQDKNNDLTRSEIGNIDENISNPLQNDAKHTADTSGNQCDNRQRDESLTFKEHNSRSEENDQSSSVVKDDIVNMSISKILNCETTDNTLFTSKKSEIEETDRNCSLSPEKDSIDVHESVSRTLEYLLSVVESKSDTLNSSPSENNITPSCSNQNKTTTHVTDFKTPETKKRRSNRIAVLESKQSLVKKSSESVPKEEEIINVEGDNEKSSIEQEETVREDPGKAFSKKTIHKSDSKSVPPLRIKLKFPLKCVPLKSRAKSKGKLDVTNTPQTNDDIPSLPNKKHDIPQKPKVKKRKKQSTGTLEEDTLQQSKTDDTKKASVSKAKGPTHVTVKKTKRLKKETTRWSPATTVELRLNNDRRVAAAGQLINNAVLDRHACVLWSSENRRHVQLSNSRASSCELDEILRRKWENLSPKEKLRYFQRARDAVRDENKHSNKRYKDEDGPSTSGTDKDSANPNVARFLSLDSRGQLSELKSRLHFYREVSPEEYTKVMTAYKGDRYSRTVDKQELDIVRQYPSCVVERQAREAKELENSKSRSKQKKHKRKVSEADSTDSHAKYRRLLYEKVCENWEKIVGIWQDKKRVQTSIFHENYRQLVRRLIAGEDVQFCDHTMSVRLSEVLYDLRQLEKEKQVIVSGLPQQKQDHEHTFNRLCEASNQIKIQPLTDSLFLGVAIETNIMNDILSEVKECDLPVLDFDTIQSVFPSSGLESSSYTTVELRHGVTSPAAVLTEWVVEDSIPSYPYTECRGAISLLTNKVVPVSNFVALQSVSGPSVQKNVTSANAMSDTSRQLHNKSKHIPNVNQSHDKVNKLQDNSKHVHDNYNHNSKHFHDVPKSLQENPNQKLDNSKILNKTSKHFVKKSIEVSADSRQSLSDSSKQLHGISNHDTAKQLQDDTKQLHNETKQLHDTAKQSHDKIKESDIKTRELRDNSKELHDHAEKLQDNFREPKGDQERDNQDVNNNCTVFSSDPCTMFKSSKALRTVPTHTIVINKQP